MVKIALALVFFASLCAVIFFSPIFRVKMISLNGSGSCITREDVVRDFKLLGKNILLISPKNLENDVKTKYLCINTVTVKKNFPNKVNLEISAYEPIVKVEGSELWLAENGLVMDKGDSTLTVTMFLPQGIFVKIGEKITNRESLFAVSLASNLLKSDFLPRSLRILESGDVAVYSGGESVAIFSSSKPVSEQVDSLQQVLALAKIDAAKISKVDLRFDKPVIQFK